MPSRTVFNKCGSFVADVRKVAKKKEFTYSEALVKRKAMLIAAISSNHSWQTFNFLRNCNNFDRQSIMSESVIAFKEGWKNINEADVEEIMNAKIDDRAYSTWLFYIIDKEQRREFKELLGTLMLEFKDGLEPLEVVKD